MGLLSKPLRKAAELAKQTMESLSYTCTATHTRGTMRASLYHARTNGYLKEFLAELPNDPDIENLIYDVEDTFNERWT